MSCSRRTFLHTLGHATAGTLLVGASARRAAAHRVPDERAVSVRRARPRPSPSQLLWQQDELAMFLHVGMNSFTDREWGDGTEDPRWFAPRALDCRQWAREARAAGFKALILTAKHHDGFCLWPTATTTHSVASSPFRGGSGDVVREFTDACRAEGVRAGLYLSPWDRNHPTYGDSPRYNAVYLAQLTELLTRYGPIHEVWHDGANGEGPNGKRQTYDWPTVWDTVRRLQPEAVVFSDAGPDVRWIGNERGVAGLTNWSTVHPHIVPVPGLDGPEVIRSLQEGDRDGTVWRPGETDVSIRPGWFHHPHEDARVRDVDNLVELFFTSVGRNSKLLLNVPPTRDGVLHPTDVSRLRGMRTRLDALFAHDLLAGATSAWRPRGTTQAQQEFALPSPVQATVLDLREDIANGQRVGAFTVEAHDGRRWHRVHEGTTIGYRRLIRLDDAAAARPIARLRVAITDAVEPPQPLTLRAWAG